MTPSGMRTLPGALIAGAFASFASTLALLWAGRRETGSYTASTNSTSHWLWDRSALVVYSPTWRHTLPGYLIHHAASTFWALPYVWLCAHPRVGRRLPRAAAVAGAVAAVACAADYTLAPRRFTPGFEHQLSRRSMALVYALFAVGLATGWAVARPGCATEGPGEDASRPDGRPSGNEPCAS